MGTQVSTPEVEGVLAGDAPSPGAAAASSAPTAAAAGDKACPSLASECRDGADEIFGPVGDCCHCDKRMEERVRVALELQLPGPKPAAAHLVGSAMRGVGEVDKTRYYREWDAIRAALTGGETRLVRGSFIESTFQLGKPLPRWQQLPNNAFWDVEDLLQDVEDLTRPTPKIIAVSYGWLSREHPDPEGFHLKVLAPMLKRYACCNHLGLESLAVFIDWCSLPQRPWSDVDQKARYRAMRSIDVWYAHQLTDVWLLSAVPEGGVPFDERGWTRFEEAAASMVSPIESVLDLAKWPDPNAEVKDWSEVVDACAVRRRPPQLPDTFAKEQESKSFAFQDDRKLVSDKYWGVFHRALGCAEHLVYKGLAWTDAEAHCLALALPRCTGLRELDLSYNELSSAGATAITRALEQCSALERLNFSNNMIGEETAQQLTSTWLLSRRPEVGLDLSAQRPSGGCSPQADIAAAQALERGVAMSMEAANPTPRNSGLLPEESKQALSALIARQAAFEARIESAMAKVAAGVVELSSAVGKDISTVPQPRPAYGRPVIKTSSTGSRSSGGSSTGSGRPPLLPGADGGGGAP